MRDQPISYLYETIFDVGRKVVDVYLFCNKIQRSCIDNIF